MKRLSKDHYYLNIAREVARRGTCLRRRYGAVIVKSDQIVSTGYTGAPRGVVNCTDIEVCLREKMRIPSGERYELCRSVHAEMNAVLHVARDQTLGSVMYLSGIDVKKDCVLLKPQPCFLCRRIIINAGIEKVVVAMEDGLLFNFYSENWIEEENKKNFKI